MYHNGFNSKLLSAKYKMYFIQAEFCFMAKSLMLHTKVPLIGQITAAYCLVAFS